MKIISLAVTTCAALLIAVAPAYAKNDKNHGHGSVHAKNEKHGNRHDNNDDDRDVNVIVINEHNRDRIRYYVERDYRANCPPGLAKKHNGCMPPGQAKKRYRVGYPLPAGVVYQPVPAYWLEDLEPVPYGYQYVRVDRDVLLISEASHKVIDAITLLSAVGN